MYLFSLVLRYTGFIQGVGFPIFWASTDSEDACVRCLRVAYTKPRTMVTLRVMRPGRYCVRKRTFAPRKSPLSTANSAGRNNQPEDLRYQNFTRTTEEVSLWLDKAGMFYFIAEHNWVINLHVCLIVFKWEDRALFCYIPYSHICIVRLSCSIVVLLHSV